MITIPLMAALGFLAVAVIWQFAQRYVPGGQQATDTGGGY